MVVVIIFSRYMKINPDNVATPIAASLGDLTTLSLLACISNSVYEAIGKSTIYFEFLNSNNLNCYILIITGNHQWLCPAILLGYLASMPCWVILAKRNKLTKKVLYSGWTPVLSAMMISRYKVKTIIVIILNSYITNGFIIVLEASS
jgi:solute carrier family 41